MGCQSVFAGLPLTWKLGEVVEHQEIGKARECRGKVGEFYLTCCLHTPPLSTTLTLTLVHVWSVYDVRRRRVDSLHWAVWHCQAEEPSRTWTLCCLGGPPLSWTLTLTHVCVYITLTLVCVWSVYDVRRWRVDSLHWAVWQCQAEEPSRTSTWTLCCLDTPPLSSRREARIFTSRLTTSTNISRYSDELQTYSISCSRELQFCWAAEQGDVGTSAGLSLTTSLETFLEAGFSRSNAHSLLRTSLIWDFTVVTGYFLYRLQFSAWHNSS